MKISVDELKTLPQHRLMVGFNEKLDGSAAVKPVLGELEISWSGSAVKIQGRLKTLLKLECDRCLRPYFQQISVDLDEKFISKDYLPDDFSNKERELHGDDFIEAIPSSGVLDITDLVYQAVTLATPSYCYCGVECPGPPGSENAGSDRAAVAGSSGKSKVESDKPIDPRWKNLKTLFPNEDSQENS